MCFWIIVIQSNFALKNHQKIKMDYSDPAFWTPGPQCWQILMLWLIYHASLMFVCVCSCRHGAAVWNVATVSEARLERGEQQRSPRERQTDSNAHGLRWRNGMETWVAFIFPHIMITLTLGMGFFPKFCFRILGLIENQYSNIHLFKLGLMRFRFTNSEKAY